MDLPARLEEKKLSAQSTYLIQIVESCICCNFFSTNKDELAENALETSTKGSSTFTPILVVFQALILTSAPTSAFGVPVLYTNVDPQKTTKQALKSFVLG